MHAPRERPRLCGVTACRWTVNWACPGSSTPGRRGYAHEDGTHAFRCCCPLRPSLLPPPPPAPPPPVFLQAFFGCERGTLEGDQMQLASSRTGDEERTRWLVVKSRDVGEPAPRLCEAELQHRGTAQQHGQSAGLAVPSSARAPPQGRAWRLRAARATQGDILGYWAPSHCLRRSSQPPPKSPNPPPLTLRRSCLGPWPALPGLRCQACRAGRASTKSEPARRSVPSCIARREAHLSSRARAASAR